MRVVFFYLNSRTLCKKNFGIALNRLTSKIVMGYNKNASRFNLTVRACSERFYNPILYVFCVVRRFCSARNFYLEDYNHF